MIYFHSYKNPGLIIDIVSDIRRINDISLKAKRAGMIILGGGVCKHQIANAMLFVSQELTLAIWCCINNRNHSGMGRTTRCISTLARSLTDQTRVRVPMKQYHGGRYGLVRRLLRYIATIHCAELLSTRSGLCRCHACISFACGGYLCQWRSISGLRYSQVETHTRQIIDGQ